MKNFAQQTVSEVFSFFDVITKIPRPSDKEEKIIAYLFDFANQHGLEVKKDSVGNVLITKPATKGLETLKTVVLQSHVDMVCEKNANVVHDFDTDPIQTYIDGEWMKAKGTTLGADCGIGVAAQLALLAGNTIPHGRLECLFTVSEETGLTGAKGLQPQFFEGKILINLDSEDEGELFIGCAGGLDTVVTIPFEQQSIPTGYVALKVSVTGLTGGHSGDDINKGLGNSIKIMNRFLWEANHRFDIGITRFDGGNLRNAIPREAFAEIAVYETRKEDLKAFFDKYVKVVKKELQHTESNIVFTIEDAELPPYIMDEATMSDLLDALYACPHGVMSMSREIEGLVETSTNLASIKFVENNQVRIATSQRSAIDTCKYDVANMVTSVFELVTNAVVQRGDGYPGWMPNSNSVILAIVEKAYKKLFDTDPAVKAIHAGLECGLFLAKYPYLDMVSFGPTIKGAHSPDERLHLPSVDKFWALLLETLQNIPAEG